MTPPFISRGDRQDRASLGHTRVRPAQLSDRCGTESAGGVVVAPAKVSVLKVKPDRPEEALGYSCAVSPRECLDALQH